MSDLLSRTNISKRDEKIKQEQIHELLFSNELSWQAVIYDLINSEQLDPWDIDLIVLAQKYLGKIREIEEADFFVSSKVLLAAALLLRIKSEILLNEHIRSLDEILFGKKEEEKRIPERIYLNDREVPLLVPKTPLPRFKKVSLNELIAALDKAINTETRRIKREIEIKQRARETDILLPRKTININDRIRNLFSKMQLLFKTKTKISYTEIAGDKRDEKIASFLPILHLDTQKRVSLQQEKHFDEIWIWLFSHYKKQENELRKQELQNEIKETKVELTKQQEKRLKKINKDFSNPLAEFFDMNE